MRILSLILSLTLSFQVMGADLVTSENDCRPQSNLTPASIPIERIEGVEKVEVASARSSINWGSVLAVGAGAAVGAAVGFFAYKAYRDYRDSKNTPPPPAPPMTPYIYPAPPQYVPYSYSFTPPGLKPVYVYQPAPLGPPPAVLPPIYPSFTSYPLFPQSSIFGASVSPIYYPTYNFNGVPTWGI